MDLNLLEYEKRLKSENREEREKALKELITYGINNLDQKTLEEYAKKHVDLVRVFKEQAHLNDSLAPATSLAIASVLQACWEDVEHILKHPSIILNELGPKADYIRKNQDALEWFYTQFKFIYYYLYILTWNVTCPRCGKRVLFTEPSFVPVEDKNGRLVKVMHTKCAIEELNSIKQYREMTAKIAEQKVRKVQKI